MRLTTKGRFAVTAMIDLALREQLVLGTNGQIYTAGNTRVYCGGEKFLGQQKGGDYRDVVITLMYQGLIASTPSMLSQASRVASYYAMHDGGPAACN